MVRKDIEIRSGDTFSGMAMHHSVVSCYVVCIWKRKGVRRQRA